LVFAVENPFKNNKLFAVGLYTVKNLSQSISLYVKGFSMELRTDEHKLSYLNFLEVFSAFLFIIYKSFIKSPSERIYDDCYSI